MALYIFHCEKFEIVMSLFSFALRNYVKHALAWTCCIPCKLGRYISTFVTKIFAKYVCLKPRPSSFLLTQDHIFYDSTATPQDTLFWTPEKKHAKSVKNKAVYFKALFYLLILYNHTNKEN